MRLFAAVQPPAHALEHLEGALDAVRGPDEEVGGVGPLRWAPPEDRHVTLAFFGEVPDGAVGEVEDGLAAVATGHAPDGVPDLAQPTAWVFGNEAWGLRDEDRALADAVVRVPIRGRAESLNLATAATVCLYASSRAQR